jgi:hypothetical protein
VGSFASAGGQSEVEIKITGNVMTPAYTLDVHFAITDCYGGGINGGVCKVVLSGSRVVVRDDGIGFREPAVTDDAGHGLGRLRELVDGSTVVLSRTYRAEFLRRFGARTHERVR